MNHLLVELRVGDPLHHSRCEASGRLNGRNLSGAHRSNVDGLATNEDVINRARRDSLTGVTPARFKSNMGPQC